MIKSLRHLSGPIRMVIANRDLRRLQLAWGISNLCGWAQWVAVAVLAYDRGGSAAVALVGSLRMLLPALAAPLLSVFGDRYPRRWVLASSDMSAAVSVGLAAVVVLLHGRAELVYVLATMVMLAHVAYRPAQGALLPALVETPAELTAANAASSTLESIAIFAGPALGGLLLALTGVGTTLAITAAGFIVSSRLVLRVAEPALDRRLEGDSAVWEQPLRGLRTIGSSKPLRLLVGVFACQTLVCGMLNVLIVILALNVLDLGDGGVGALNAAVGLGALGAGLAAFSLLAGRLALSLTSGLVLWGLPLVILGARPSAPMALVALAIVGIGNTLIDVAGFTLLQRAVPEDILARVFGVLVSVMLFGVALGSALAPFAISAVGIRGALVASGAFLVIVAGLSWRQLHALDQGISAHPEELQLLKATTIFQALPPATLELVASQLVKETYPAGAVVVRQGDLGERFYVIARGEVTVTVDGRRGKALGPGESFGEIALVRNVPRTATVSARTDIVLFALSRDDFVALLSGHPQSAAVADAAISARLRSLRPSIASI